MSAAREASMRFFPCLSSLAGSFRIFYELIPRDELDTHEGNWGVKESIQENDAPTLMGSGKGPRKRRQGENDIGRK